jgi:hypothetical protein
VYQCVSRAAPGMDTVMALAGLAVTVAAASIDTAGSNDEYGDSGDRAAMDIRSLGVAIGVGSALLFGGAAAHGYNAIDACEHAREEIASS